MTCKPVFTEGRWTIHENAWFAYGGPIGWTAPGKNCIKCGTALSDYCFGGIPVWRIRK